MRSARKEPNQRVCKASPEKTSGRGSAPARHAAKHAKKRSLFGRAKQEDPVPETAAPAPQPEAAEEEHTINPMPPNQERKQRQPLRERGK